MLPPDQHSEQKASEPKVPGSGGMLADLSGLVRTSVKGDCPSTLTRLLTASAFVGLNQGRHW
jgi:hypothetical protein